jgi:thiol-disulfide isomerase/thioredoxin
MHKSFLSIAVSLALVGGSAHASPFESRPLAEVLDQAKREGKVAFVDFYANWCGPCKQVDATVYPDPKVQTWLKQYTVPVAIDGERGQGPDLRERYKLMFYPTMLLLKPDGTELGRYVGSLGVEDFLRNFEQIRTGQDRVKTLEKAVARDPKAFDQRLELVNLLLDQDKKKKASEHLLALLDSDTQWAGFAANELLSDDEKKDEKLAKRIDERTDGLFKTANDGKASPGQLAALVGLLGARHRAEDLIKLETQLGGADLDGETRFGLVRRAAAAQMDGKRYEQAVALLQASTQWSESHPPADSASTEDRYEAKQHLSYLYGELYKALLLAGRPADAKSVAEHSLGLDSDVNNYNRLAWAAFEAEKSDEYSLTLARKGHELAHGEDLNMADTLANVLQQLGKKDEALAVIDAAVKTTNSPKRIKEFQTLRESITNPKKDDAKKT